MNRLVILLGMVGAVGCSGSDDPADEGSIVGKWAAELNAACITGFAANDAGIYEGDIACQLQNGTVGVEAEVGNYSISGSEITITPTHASCPSSDHSPGTATFEVNGDVLKLVFPSGILALERLPESSGGTVVAAYGCMDVATGQFTQHDVEPL